MRVAELDSPQSRAQKALHGVLRPFSIPHNAEQWPLVPRNQLACPRAATARGVHFEDTSIEVRGQEVAESLACGEFERPVQLLQIEQDGLASLLADLRSRLQELGAVLVVGLRQGCGQRIGPPRSCSPSPPKRWFHLMWRTTKHVINTVLPCLQMY